MLITDLCIAGAKLQTLRKKTHLTQWDVAEMAGVSSRTYADIERGTVCPRVDTLIKICQALQITPDAILVADEEIKKEHREVLFSKLDLLSAEDQAFLMKMMELYIQTTLA